MQARAGREGPGGREEGEKGARGWKGGRGVGQKRRAGKGREGQDRALGRYHVSRLTDRRASGSSQRQQSRRVSADDSIFIASF